MEISFCELRTKDVINIYDGKNLGKIIDMVIDTKTCKICGIVVPCDRSIFNIFSSSPDIFIPFCKIIKIGKDIIIVELSPIISKQTSQEVGACNNKKYNTDNINNLEKSNVDFYKEFNK